MKQVKTLLVKPLLLTCIIIAACSASQVKNEAQQGVSYTASTRGDSLIKAQLGIPAATKVDFIRWKLNLLPGKNKQGTFTLGIHFGEGKQGTPDFIGGGEKLNLKGSYTISENIYHFKGEGPSASFFMLRLNDNLFHLLTSAEGGLMVGDGGWSYVLNREEPVENTSDTLAFLHTSQPGRYKQQEVFDGRSPCTDLAKEYKLDPPEGCMKIKWRLTLNRDASGQPTTYSLKKIFREVNETGGKWTIVKGTAANPSAVIYRLKPDKEGAPLSFLAGDDNILYFLDREDRLLTGDENFSYVLNRINR